MSKDVKLMVGSTIYGKIQAARMSEHDRRLALHAMRNAERFVNAVIWAKRGIDRLGSWLLFKPSLKH